VAREVNASGVPLQPFYEPPGQNGQRPCPPGGFPFTPGIRADVNKFAQPENGRAMPIQRVAAAVERDQVKRLQGFRAARDPGAVEARLTDVRGAAEGSANLMPIFVNAVDAGATLGEICNVLRTVFGTHVARERIA
jgi:hypothetical protein